MPPEQEQLLGAAQERDKAVGQEMGGRLEPGGTA
jgi:hypothetical protein